jgi:hypothetical protein
MNFKLIIFLVSATLLFSSNILAKVYKWTDSNGKVHYSDKPIETKDVKELKLDTQKPDPKEVRRMNIQNSKIRSKQRALSRNNNQSQSRSSLKSSSTSQSQAAKDRARCEEYKKRLAKYQREGVLGINPITGQRKMMQGEGKRQAIENARTSVEIFCS